MKAIKVAKISSVYLPIIKVIFLKNERIEIACNEFQVGKGGFFSESAIRFSNLQISKKNIAKNYPELEI